MEKQTTALLEKLRQSGEALPQDLREANDDTPTSDIIAMLIDVVTQQGTLTATGTIAVRSLPQFEGEAALEAILQAYEASEDVLVRHNLAEALAAFRVRDARVLDILLNRIEAARNRRKLPTWICELARHGNPDALPRLCAWFDAAKLDPTDVLDRLIAQAIAYAVETLGGEFVGEKRGMLDQAGAEPETPGRDAEPADTTPAVLQYDASVAPDQNAWLTASEHDRVNAICQHHLIDTPHVQPDDLGRHAMVHTIVENHIAEEFPSIREACERLQDEGLSRHDTIHALGQKAFELIAPVLESDAKLDPHALIDAYQDASAKDYLENSTEPVAR